ncbi:MAG: BamA/TamA family outer membrane protein [Burkholderiaceae bacterium]|nr:BamA/TamA family outer membrane protein [Burkholderiaceae bacterium]
MRLCASPTRAAAGAALVACALLLTGCSLFPREATVVDADAPQPAPTLDATPQGAVGTRSATPEATAFDIDVRAPEPARALLATHLELNRFRAVTDLDEAELARLIELADRDARNLLGTLGYFNPLVDIHREGAVGQRPTIVVVVTPGEQTRVTGVDIRFAGDIATSADPAAQAQRDELRRLWSLPVGRPFTQDDWDSAKTQATRRLTEKRYPAGRITATRAEVNADNNGAQLGLTAESGPLFRLGAMQVTGMQRYDPDIVPRLARLPAGSVYDQSELVEAQQRLSSSGYFDSAYIFIDPEGDANAAPVQVNVREAPLKRVVLGVGLTTDSGPRASIEHTHNRVPYVGWRVTNKLQLERKQPHIQTDWLAPPDDDSWRWGVLGRAERLDDDELITQTQRLRVGRSRNEDNIDRNIYLQYDRASVRAAGGVDVSSQDAGDGSALTANYVWTGRYFDNNLNPSSGFGLGLELGAGITLGTEKKPFTRVVGRWLGIRPLGTDRGRLALRAEAGGVFADEAARIPSTQQFRTGGDSTVRGYAYRSIGIPLDGGLTGPGRYMVNGSIEWQRPLRRNGMATEFDHTVFLDGGAVADKPGALKPVFGVGTGVRWRSPVGPLQADIAYGLDAKKFRLHLSVGFVF